MESSKSADLNIPKIFKKKRVVNEIINILTTKPGMRNSTQLRKIALFLNEIKLFKTNITEQSQLRDICNCLKLKDCIENELIFKQGDFGTTYYLILSGAVNGFVNKRTEEFNEK